jgi:DNA-binding transcriptional MerR regulator
MAPARTTDPDSEWLSVAEAAAAADVPRRTAFRWVKKGLVDYREDELGRTVTVASLRRLRAAPLSATVARRGTGKTPAPGYKILGLRHDPDETADELDGWMPGVDERLEDLERRLKELEKHLARRLAKQ